jgi:glucose/mannose transport system substrate-binding protein
MPAKLFRALPPSTLLKPKNEAAASSGGRIGNASGRRIEEIDMRLSLFAAMTAAIALQAGGAYAEEPVAEVIHHWVSEGEAAALGKLRENLATKGIGFKDSAIGGLSGVNASQALRARILAQNPPTAMQQYGLEPVTWAEQNELLSLNDLAAAGNWDAVIPDAMKALVKYKDDWIAAPVNMHRTNWIWGNAKLFEKIGAQPPKTWDELISVAEKFKAQGIKPFANSDEAWQVGLIFDDILSGLNGAEFYKKVAIDLDPEAMKSPEMIAVFDMLRRVRNLTDANFVGRNWADATAMVANGDAAMQFMGDWAKGEFTGKKLVPGTDYLCIPSPGKENVFLFVSDVLVFFKTDAEASKKVALSLAETTMDPAVQKDFNLIKGSIPARTDVSLDGYDSCALQAQTDRDAAAKSGLLFGDLSNTMVARAEFTSVFSEVGAKFFVSNMSSQEAVDLLVTGIENAR